MKAARTFTAILFGLLLTPALLAQSPKTSADPILDFCVCEGPSEAMYEWGLWVDYDGNGSHERRLFRGCDSILSYWAEGEELWAHIGSSILRNVGNAPPTLRKEVTDTGTFWHVEERDATSEVVICESWLSGRGEQSTDCVYKRIGTHCYFPFGTETADTSELSGKKE